MDQGSLVREQIDAGATFLHEFDKVAHVVLAFWLKESEDGRWVLYVAPCGVNDANFDVAYGEVLRIAGEMKDPNLDVFQIRLLRRDDPLLKAVAGRL